MLTEEAIEQLARAINPADVLKYIEEHKEDNEEFIKKYLEDDKNYKNIYEYAKKILMKIVNDDKI